MRQTVSRPRDRSFEKNDFPIGAFRDDKQQSPLRRGFIETQNRKLFLQSRPEIFSISITAGRSRADSNSIPRWGVACSVVSEESTPPIILFWNFQVNSCTGCLILLLNLTKTATIADLLNGLI